MCVLLSDTPFSKKKKKKSGTHSRLGSKRPMCVSVLDTSTNTGEGPKGEGYEFIHSDRGSGAEIYHHAQMCEWTTI